MSILDAKVVDIVGVDPDKGIARLVITDHLEWTDPLGEHLLLLQEKINGYLRFLEGESWSNIIRTQGDASVRSKSR